VEQPVEESMMLFLVLLAVAMVLELLIAEKVLAVPEYHTPR
jgi:hypothetical protein